MVRRTMLAESLEPRVLMAADPIHVGVVYIETDYLESDADVGSDSQPDRFILSFTGGAENTQLTELRVRTDKDGDGLSVGDPMFDTQSGGRGKGGNSGFKVVRYTSDDPVQVTATVEDGGQELVLRLSGFHAGDRLEFTLDVDEILRMVEDLAAFNNKLDVITSGQEFEDSILEATFEAPHFEAANADALFLNDFGDPASSLGLSLPPDEGDDVDSRPNRTAAALATTHQVPKPISIAGTVWIDNDLDLLREANERGLAGVQLSLLQLDATTGTFVDTGHRTTTNAQGQYKFEAALGLMPGTFRVAQTQPAGYYSVGAVPGSVSGTRVGTALSADMLTGIVIAKGDLHAVNYDFAEAQPASVSGYVYRDDNDDGRRDAAEPGIGNVRVRLIPISTLSPQTQLIRTTDANGFYRFENLSPGEYRIEELDQPEGLTDGLDAAGTVNGRPVGEANNPGDSIDAVVLAGNQKGIEYNFGELPLGSISGMVYLAGPGQDCDGYDAGVDLPLPGVRVVLQDANATVIAETVTDANGLYSFGQVPKGNYTILEYTPDGLIDGHASAGRIGNVTVGQGIGGGRIERLLLPAGADAVGYDFCEAAPASVSGHVYHDRDQDGRRDSGEEPIANTRVDLVDAAGKVVDTQRTDADGFYRFDDVLPGSYSIREFQPEGFYDGRDTAGTVDGQRVGRAENPGDTIGQVVLRQGQTGVDFDFGELRPASLSGRVHVDTDGDCMWDEGELLLAGVVMQLRDSDGNLVAQTQTNAQGRYRFDNIQPGRYTVVELQPQGYFDGSQMAGSAGGDASGVNRIADIDLGSGEVAVNYNFCEDPPAEISGVVFADRNGNCLLESHERPIAGVRVDLLDANGTQVATTITDAQGRYTFSHLHAGVYTVRETQPVGYFHGGQRAGSAGGNDSVADLISAVPIGFGDRLIDYNFCELEPSALGGYVFIDRDSDCVFDANELPLTGVEVQLLNESGEIVARTETAADGQYRFENLAPGRYSVRELQPVGYFQGGQVVGDGGGEVIGVDHLGKIDIGPGQTLSNYDFCELEPSSLGGFVFVDRDGDSVFDGSEPPLAGVEVQLLNEDGEIIARAQTAADGQYRFENLRPGRYSVRELQPVGYFQGGQVIGDGGGRVIGDDHLGQINIGPGQTLSQYNFYELEPSSLGGFVYVDRDANCVFDADELPLAGVEVQLLNEAGEIVARVQTASDGQYRFENLPSGRYSVRELQPAGYYQGGQVVGDGGGVVLGDDHLGRIDIAPGQSLSNYDFCELEGGSLSGRVWSETDLNKRFDNGEVPIGGVLIELIDATGKVVASTTTSPAGRYEFTDLAPGTYRIRESQPAQWFHGGQVPGSLGGRVVGDDLLGGIQVGGGQHGVNYDFPEVPPATISGYIFQDGPALSTGTAPPPADLRDYRDGVRGPGDPALPGVRLELRNVLGQPFTADRALPGVYAAGSIFVTTDANGYYEFTGLRPGTYHIYEIQPDDYIDGLDTPGSTGGLAVNVADIADDVELQFIVQTLSASGETNPNDDAILNIDLSAGGHSTDNNFSEIIVRLAPPPLPPIDHPQPEVPQPVAAPLPTTAHLVSFAVPQYHAPPAFYDLAYPVSWHLSVINAGSPRDKVAGEDAVVRSASASTDPEFDASKHRKGRWSLVTRTGERLELSDALMLGEVGAIPLSGDFNGDGRDELAIFVGGQWFVDINGNGRWDAGDLWISLGTELDRPVIGDWDGDGKDDVGIFGRQWVNDPQAIISEPGLPAPTNRSASRPKNLPPVEPNATEGMRRMRRNHEAIRADLIDHVFQYGQHHDTPLAGDWNGEGIDAIAVFRAGVWRLDEDGDGRWTGADREFKFGSPGSKPVVGDWNGDGIDDFGVVENDVWILDSDGDRKLTAKDQRVVVPPAGRDAQPVAGDWDGDGRDEPGSYSTDNSTENDSQPPAEEPRAA